MPGTAEHVQLMSVQVVPLVQVSLSVLEVL